MNPDVEFVADLLAIQCYYTYVVEKDGTCKSTRCGFKNNPETKYLVQKHGCRFYETHSYVKNKRETEGERENERI